MSEQQMVLPSGERGEKFLFSVIMPVYNTEKWFHTEYPVDFGK